MIRKVANYYAGVGGNRVLWGDEVHVTAIEYDEEIAAVYAALWPNDKVVVADAHQHMLEHLNEFDLIWSSPPCQSHSQIRYNLGYVANRQSQSKVKPLYPDLRLYEEILLLQHYCESKWVVENTIPYYQPLIAGKKVAGHIWWSNFEISPIQTVNRGHRNGTITSLQQRKGIDLSKFKIGNKRQILRNCVEPEVGLHVLECAKNNPILGK